MHYPLPLPRIPVRLRGGRKLTSKQGLSLRLSFGALTQKELIASNGEKNINRNEDYVKVGCVGNKRRKNSLGTERIRLN
jgi:hypothetical protein